ncbi:MAG: V4R domain-containing protein [Candidatus Nanohalobium sp.]
MVNESSIFSQLMANGEFRVDDKGHAILNGQFLLMIPPPVILELQEDLENRYGRKDMEEIMLEAGEFQLEQALNRYKDRYDLEEVSRENILEFFNQVGKVLGWGDIEIRTEGENPVVTVEYPTLPSVYRNRGEELADRPICHYLRGMSSKAVSSLLGEEITLKEEKCAATGGDICRFEVPKD